VETALLIGLRLKVQLALRFGGPGLGLCPQALGLLASGLRLLPDGLCLLSGSFLFVFGGLLGTTQDIAQPL
jgi:hypothetical protein